MNLPGAQHDQSVGYVAVNRAAQSAAVTRCDNTQVQSCWDQAHVAHTEWDLMSPTHYQG
jgi:hypothetical protein